MSPTDPPQSHHDGDHENEEDVYLDAADAAEEIAVDADHPMDSGDEDEDGEGANEQHQELTFQNDSRAHFDHHGDSIFCIAQHPVHRNIVITGSGDDTAYIFDATPAEKERPLLPRSYESPPAPEQHQQQDGQQGQRESLGVIAKLDGHTDSVNAVAFTEPKGEYAITAGLDGKLRVWRDSSPSLPGQSWEFLAEAQEVEEINWVATCPVDRAALSQEEQEQQVNVVALGASNGSVWVYKIDKQDKSDPVAMVQAFFQHTEPCTAGAWTPDGKLLATVAEDGSFYVYDVFGAAAAAGIAPSSSAGSQALVALTAQDQRFAVEGGLYSVAVAPSGTFAAVGGAEGHIKIVGLPRLSTIQTPSSTSKQKGKTKGGGGGGGAAQGSSGDGSSGTLLASLQAQSDGVETLSFSSPPLNLLAAGSVDGSIALFDTAHRFAVRRHIRGAHEENAVVKVEFVPEDGPHSREGGAAAPSAAGTTSGRPWLLTSVGMDGVVRRWDARGGTTAAGYGLLMEWKGHVGMMENEDGERSGGIMGFVQGAGGGQRIVTAGDDGVALVFEE